MGEFFVGIWAAVMGFFLWWPVIIGFLLFGIWWMEESLDFTSKNFQWGAFIINAILMYGIYNTEWFGVMLSFEWFHLFAYFVVGMLWSFLRYSRYGAHVAEMTTDKKARRSALEVSNNTGRIATWILVWPLSYLRWALSDVVTTVERLITVHLRGVYQRIADKYIDA